MQVIHPMQLPIFIAPPIRRRSFGSREAGMSGGFFDDLADTLWDSVTGLTSALGSALNDIVHAVEKIGETVALIVRACLGDANWSDVLDELGSVFQDIGGALILLSPSNQLFSWLSTSRLTAHAFHELDKFTGGDITTLKNLSTLPGRVLAGEPIATNELIKDALMVIEVVAIILTFPEGLAVAVAMMVGKQVCSHQTEAKEACMLAFEIVGLAVGGWAADWAASGDTALEDEFENLSSDGSIEDAWLEVGDDTISDTSDLDVYGDVGITDDAVAAGADTAAGSSGGIVDTIAPYLEDAGQTVLTNEGITLITREANVLCQTNKWAGRNECQILSQVLNDYLKSDDDEDWVEFLADEIGKIGAEELMLQWFPHMSPEWIAINSKKPPVVNTVNVVGVPQNSTQYVTGVNPWTFLLVAAGAATFLLGATS